mmetsp:Transcript_1347/g.4409  ORF Transcript_1347/g.4409 Transcript_1347/m.4409 type:complete len:100 (+) Transcript_1347:1227-1526(+)
MSSDVLDSRCVVGGYPRKNRPASAEGQAEGVPDPPATLNDCKSAKTSLDSCVCTPSCKELGAKANGLDLGESVQLADGLIRWQGGARPLLGALPPIVLL